MSGQKQGEKYNHAIRDFGGVNTQAARQAIDDDEFSWLENMMPIGHGNLVSVPGPVDTGASVSGSAYYMKSANLNNTDFMFMFTADGAAYAINLASFAKTTVAPAATFSGSKTQFDQWKNDRILIADANGYFSWDGTTLQKLNGAVISVLVTANGTGYTSRPTVAINGSGTGATANAIVGSGTATVSAGGAGYVIGDVLTVVGGTQTIPAQFRVATLTGTAVATVTSVTLGDYTATPVSPAATTGGSGTGCTLTPVWGVGSVVVTNGGSGFTANPSVAFTGGAGSGATATATYGVAPGNGSCVAVYSGRVWIASGRTVSFSAPDSYSDFSTTNLGGSFIMEDSTLHSNIIQLLSANGFMYIVGLDSINVVSDVRVTTSPGATLFSNLNLVTTAGTASAGSVIPYYRTIWLAAPYGFYGITGSTAQKGSDKLDGVFKYINSATGFSAGIVVINKILCLAFMFTYADPVSGNRPILAVFFNKKWFICSQGNALTQCAYATVGGTQNLYATDGTKLWKLFADATVGVAQTIKTKLWDMGDPLTDKQVLKMGVETIMPSVAGTLTATVDSELASSAATLSATSSATWINNSGATVTWQNNALALVTWIASGYVWFRGDATSFGKYAGITIQSSTPQLTIMAEQLQYELRARW